MLSHIASFLHLQKAVFLASPTRYHFTCCMTTSELSSQYTDSRTVQWVCGQRATYPSICHDTWSLVALPSRQLPPRLSCYTALADLIPWLDNSPFFSNSIFPTPFLWVWPGHPSTLPLVRLPAWITEESWAWPPSHPCLESTKSKMSILCSQLFKISQHHIPFGELPVFFVMRMK